MISVIRLVGIGFVLFIIKVIVLCVFLSLLLLAKVIGDSFSYFIFKDIIFLLVGQFNEKYFNYYLELKQMLFLLVKFYGFFFEEFYFYNLGFSFQMMWVGMLVCIFIFKQAIEQYQEKDIIFGWFVLVYYVVCKGDIFYKIFKFYFDIFMEDIMMCNGLLDYILKSN